jgi:hypothetical protein
MTAAIRNLNKSGWVARYLPSAAMSLAGSAACYWAAGPTLGVFFGGLFVATFLTPGAVLAERKLAVIAAVVGPIAGVWLAAALQAGDPIGQWVEVTIVLTAYSLTLGGTAAGLARCGLPKILAAAGAIMLGLAWLTWPVWLSPALERGFGERVVQFLVKIHPPLVANGVLTHEPAWTERSIAYHLTDLDQDVPVRLPNGIGACVAAHGVLGAGLWWAAARNPRRAWG